MKRLLTLSLPLFTLLAPSAGNAAKFSPLFTSAFEFGGNTLVNVTYADGSKSVIDAGRGLNLRGGIDIDFTESRPHAFEIQSTLGIKRTSSSQASNGSIHWTRIPWEFLAFYRNRGLNFRIGGGLTYQFANELKGSNGAAGISTRFNNAIGAILEGDYFIGPKRNVALGMRHTSIRYRARSEGSSSINGNSFGLNFHYFWF